VIDSLDQLTLGGYLDVLYGSIAAAVVAGCLLGLVVSLLSAATRRGDS